MNFRLKYGLAGIAFGLLFPIGGFLFEFIRMDGWNNGLGFLDVHTAHPLLFIIDSAPLVLGIAGYWIGSNLRDLEKAHRAQSEALERSEKIRFQLLDHSNLIVITLDSDLDISYLNQMAQDLSGKVIDLHGTSPSITSLIPDFPSKQDLEKAKIYHGKDLERLAFSTPENEIPVHLTIAPIGGENEKESWLIVGRDISHEEATKAQLSITLDQLGAAHEDLEGILYASSHDLRTPLRGIMSLAEFIEEELGEEPGPKITKYLNLLKSRVFRMQNLIRGLQVYTRSGGKDAESQTINVNEEVGRLCKDIVSQPFQVKIQEELPDVRMNLAAFREIWSQLITNAVVHHEDKTGRIEIGFKNNEFFIQDDGPGIKPAFHDRIFEVFTTLKSRDEQELAGVGLAVVKKILRSLQCTISLTSDAGQGSTFHFTLPLAKASPDSIKTKNPTKVEEIHS